LYRHEFFKAGLLIATKPFHVIFSAVGSPVNSYGGVKNGRMSLSRLGKWIIS